MEVSVSIVIPVRRAKATIESTLAAAISQARDAGGEVIAAIWRGDPAFTIVSSIAERETILRVVVADHLCGVPQLRRDAVRVAQGVHVVITEDHCLFPPGWLLGLLGSEDVRGGAVSNGRRNYPGWAQYFTRYNAFLPPVARGPATHLPGNNACYPRRLLERAPIEEGFWEAELNRELRDRGVRFFADPSLTVEQRQQRAWFEFAILRYQHGRCYGGRRAGGKFALLIRSPLIPLVLLLRQVRSVANKRYHVTWFLLTLPLQVCYLIAWSCGEVAGYMFGVGDSCRNTD